MPDKAWKRTERAVALLLDGERIPVTGRARGDTPDISHDHLSIECKSRKHLPDWLHEAIEQAEAANRTGDRISVVILHETGKRHADDFVLLRLRDFSTLINAISPDLTLRSQRSTLEKDQQAATQPD